MPELSNPKHESFAIARAKGQSVEIAYATAGYTPHRGNSYRLNKDKAVVARIAELSEILAKNGAEAAAVDRAWVLTKLIENARAAMEGEPIKNAKGKVVGRKTERSVANRALELIGKELGMFKEKIELGGHVQVANMDLLNKLTPAERAAMRALLVAAQARAKPANQNGVVPEGNTGAALPAAASE
jgi:hypothetical protein